MIGLSLGLGLVGQSSPSQGESAPPGQSFLTDEDGVQITDEDGVSITVEEY